MDEAWIDGEDNIEDNIVLSQESKDSLDDNISLSQESENIRILYKHVIF